VSASIRFASDADAQSLLRLAALDSQRPLSGRSLIAELDGEPVAAVSIADRRALADPFRPTADAVLQLRVRAAAVLATGNTSVLPRLGEALAVMSPSSRRQLQRVWA
jgi:hypothetical protein